MADNKTSKKNELNMDNNDQMLEKEKMQETETKEKALQGANASLGENMLFGADSDEKETEEPPFINQLYDKIASVLGADDANQFLCLTIPGQVVSAEDFSYDYKNHAPKGPTVEANESRLANKLYDPARIAGADNGLTLPYQYRTALDMLTPKLNKKIADAKIQLRQLLMTEYPYDFGDKEEKKYTLQEVFFRLYDEWAKEAKKWAETKNKKKKELRERYPGTDNESNIKYNDEYLTWYETVAEEHMNTINEKMSKVISVFTPNDMKILEGILDAGSGAELQQARQVLTNTQKLTPEGGYVYPVKFNPTNWFELLDTSFTPIDLLSTPDVLSTKLLSLSKRRIDLNSRIAEIAELIPKDVEKVKSKVDEAKKKLDDAESKLIKSYGEGFKAVLDTALDIAPLFVDGGVPIEIIKKLVNNANLKDNELKEITDCISNTYTIQQEYVEESQNLANAMQDAVQAENMAYLKHMLMPLKEQLEEINMEISDLQLKIQLSNAVYTGDNASDVTPPSVPKGFERICISASASSLVQENTMNSSSSVSTSGASFLFCGYHANKSKASSHFEDFKKSKENKIEIGMNVAKIGIEREWFNPGVFALTKDMFNVTTLRISPNPQEPYTEMTDHRITEMATHGSVFPCYPVAMVLARDISVKLTTNSNEDSTFSDMVEQHAAVGGGFLLFSGSSSSSSEEKSSGVHSVAKDQVITLKFDTPQIIGYYMEATPADKSTYIDNNTEEANAAGYVTIKQFVEKYRNLLEEMNKKKENNNEPVTED